MPTTLQSGYCVYLLQCADASLYCGATKCLPRRLQQHQEGKASRYTRCRLPVKLVYAETLPTWSAALKREYAIKQLPTPAKHKLIAIQGYAKQNLSKMKTTTVLPRAMTVKAASKAGQTAAANLIKNFAPKAKKNLRTRLAPLDYLPVPEKTNL